MKRRPRLQIKPNIGSIITNSQTNHIEKSNNINSDTYVDENELNNITVKNQLQTISHGEPFISLNREITPHSPSKNQEFLLKNETEKNQSLDLFTQNNGIKDTHDKGEELVKSQESALDSKVKRRARITIKPNFVSKSLTQLSKSKLHPTDDKSVSFSTHKNTGSLLTSATSQELPPKIKTPTNSTSNILNDKSQSFTSLVQTSISNTETTFNLQEEAIHKNDIFNNTLTNQDTPDITNSNYNLKQKVDDSQPNKEALSICGDLGGINLNEIIAPDQPLDTDNINNNEENDNKRITRNKGITNNSQDSTIPNTTSTTNTIPTSTINNNSDDIIDDAASHISNISSTSLNDKAISSQQLDQRLVSKKIKERQKSRLTEPMHEPVDMAVVCMKDLIYMNPVNNPMKYRMFEEKKKKMKKGKEGDDNDGNISDSSSVISNVTCTSVSTVRSATTNKSNIKVDNNNKGGDDVAVPQIEIGTDGKIIINEKSLEVVDESDGEMEVVNETDVRVSGYPKKNRTRTWGINETKKFYAALSMIGTDFSLMTQVFADRPRQDLKRKFKREDKVNRFLVDAALKERRPLDITLLAEPVVEEVAGKRKTKARKLEKKMTSGENNFATPDPPAEVIKNRIKFAKKGVNNGDGGDSVISGAGVVSKSDKVFEGRSGGVEKGGSDNASGDDDGEGVSIEKIVPGRVEKRKRLRSARINRKFMVYDASDSDDALVKEEEEVMTKRFVADDNCSEVSSVVTLIEHNDDDFSNDVEIVKMVCKKRTKSGRISMPPFPFDKVSSPLPSTIKTPGKRKNVRLKQQLRQMEEDRRQKTIKGVLTNFDEESRADDNDSNFDTISMTDSVSVSEHHSTLVHAAEDTLGERLKHLHSNLNIVDHQNIDLNELGISEVPPQHRLVIVSQNLGDSRGNEGPTGDDEMEMHVFVVSDVTLASVVQISKETNRDAVEILFSLIQHNAGGENSTLSNKASSDRSGYNDENNNVDVDKNDAAVSKINSEKDET